MEIDNDLTPPNIEITFNETPIQLSTKSSKYYIYNSLQQQNHTDKKAFTYIKNPKTNFTINSIFTYSLALSNLIDYVGSNINTPLTYPIHLYIAFKHIRNQSKTTLHHLSIRNQINPYSF